MPLVTIKRNPDQISDQIIKNLTNILPSIIADTLSVAGNKEAQLTKDDIEISVTEHGHLDVNVLPLQIAIFANDYPERKATLKERTDEIARRLQEILPTDLVGKQKAFVWVLLVPG